MSFKVVIPARYDSTRFPGKPLARIAGEPMIRHVWQRACDAGAEAVIIATDDHSIRTHCEQFGARVCMTSPDARSGTDRVAEAVAQLGWADEDVVVNLQGDEPLMPVSAIRDVADQLINEASADIGTLCWPVETTAELMDPNVVKVVIARSGSALYFSRAPIPWDRDNAGSRDSASGHTPRAVYRHIGLYAYRAGVLGRLAKEPPCELEEIECLEQLRALWIGLRIQVRQAGEMPGPGVDTPEDLEKVESLLSSG
ncbi:3-deoxy-manno-octulosonate cytidylyltransferase [Natronospira bacteriovora]|uniref:3-deoxy-manno-octulosonate cytidylyltransferase n=1 Tax=Natronospira bacteriovora TaxID=3069753 RepID=A0ABU0W2L1_9GAMM|nr:3-deoxy-manno-octulosonate cytidylyltransferase [Natronospira sp. AB-CW4]MDQ2068255.1 3-deoxy-manno-octulosonate cytidylyltransferase [Natronospira sp. AB-CW4]